MANVTRRQILRAMALGGGLVAGKIWIPGQTLISIPKPQLIYRGAVTGRWASVGIRIVDIPKNCNKPYLAMNYIVQSMAAVNLEVGDIIMYDSKGHALRAIPPGEYGAEVTSIEYMDEKISGREANVMLFDEFGEHGDAGAE